MQLSGTESKGGVILSDTDAFFFVLKIIKMRSEISCNESTHGACSVMLHLSAVCRRREKHNMGWMISLKASVVCGV